MRRIWAICTVSVLTAGCQASLIGRVIPPWPAGLHEGQGNCFNSAHVCEAGLGVLNDQANVPKVIYAWIRPDQKVSQLPAYRVTDTIRFPQLHGSQLWERGVCRNGSTPDDTIMALVEPAKTEWLSASEWAYRVDKSSGRFVRLDPRLVDCYDTAKEAD